MKTKEGTPIQGRISTHTGRWFFPLAPTTEDIDAYDIAHALSNQCRFTGHTKSFYSVAEHSCRVHDILPDKLKKWGLLHDAAEAYLMDLPAPLKQLEEMDLFKVAEAEIMKCVCAKFGLDEEMPMEVHDADKILLFTEIRDLMNFEPSNNGYRPLPDTIIPWSPRKARKQMLYRMERVGIEVRYHV